MLVINLNGIWQALVGGLPFAHPDQWAMLILVGLAIPIAVFLAILGIGLALTNWCLRGMLGNRAGGAVAGWLGRQLSILIRWTAAAVVGLWVLPYALPILLLLGLVWLTQRLVRGHRGHAGRAGPAPRHPRP